MKTAAAKNQLLVSLTAAVVFLVMVIAGLSILGMAEKQDLKKIAARQQYESQQLQDILERLTRTLEYVNNEARESNRLAIKLAERLLQESPK